MRFDPCICPRCGEGPYRILATVETVTRLEPLDDGTFEFGDSAVSWETQAPLIAEGQVTLYCRYHHGFRAELVPDDEPQENAESNASGKLLKALQKLETALEFYPHWKSEMVPALLAIVRAAIAVSDEKGGDSSPA